MSRILVTGSAGLVGRRLCQALADAGHVPVGFDLARDPVQDVRNVVALVRAMEGCDGVFHLAAISRVAWGEADPALCESINVAGTRALLAVAGSRSPAAPWVVFASSREVYGDPATVPVHEGDPREPVNAYGRSKLRGEELVERAAAGLRTAVVRLSSVYGTEHDHPDRAVPALLWRAMRGEDLVLTGPDAFFDFVHVDDTVRGLMLAARALAAGSGSLPPVHLATGTPTSLRDLALLAIGTAGSRSAVVARPARSFDVSGFCGDPARAQALLGFRTEVTLVQGLRRLRDLLAERGRAPDPVLMPRVPAPVTVGAR